MPAEAGKKIPWMVILIFLGLSLLISVAGFLFYRSGKAEIKKNIENDLAAIADLKVHVIETWRQERLANASVIRDNQLTTGRIAQWLRNPADPAVTGSLLIWMAALQRENGYQSVLLLDASGKPRLATRPDNLAESSDPERIAAVMASQDVVFSDLYRTRQGNIYLDLYTPLLQEGTTGSSVIGIMVLRIDPYTFLFPLIQSWPTPSRSAETLIVRREGNRALFLNDLRHREGSALTLSAPLEPALLSREKGVTEAVDYRGVPVLAAHCPVPNTPWVMVAKVDTEEIYAPIRERAKITLVVVILLTAVVGTAVSIGWQKQAAQFYRKQLEGERERQALAQQLLEREQQARQQAEEASRMKDEFLATVSHELRTPLNPILGWAYNLRTGEVDAALLQEGLEAIERNARIQSQLVEDLLDVSRIVTGKLKMDVQPVDLRRVIEAAVESVHLAAQAKRIELSLQFDADVPAVAGDPARLQQVFWNVLSNALKFTPEAGRVEVRLRSVDSHVEAVVTDNGEGIPVGFLPQVFDRFTQADSSVTRKHGGLGVGLAIARHLVEAHGGTIRADSAGSGRGATFSIRLPATGSAG